MDDIISIIKDFYEMGYKVEGISAKGGIKTDDIISMIKAFDEMGYTVEEIAQITGYPVEEIVKYREDNQ